MRAVGAMLNLRPVQKYMRISIPLLHSNVIFRCWIVDAACAAQSRAGGDAFYLGWRDGAGGLIRGGGAIDRGSVMHGGFGVMD